MYIPHLTSLRACCKTWATWKLWRRLRRASYRIASSHESITRCAARPPTDKNTCKEEHIKLHHYNDVIMGTMASQITSLTIVYSSIYSDADQRWHQSSASLYNIWVGNSPVIGEFPPHKWPGTLKMFPFDDVIMTLDLKPRAVVKKTASNDKVGVMTIPCFKCFWKSVTTVIISLILYDIKWPFIRWYVVTVFVWRLLPLILSPS